MSQFKHLAAKFCDYHNRGLSKGQIMMIEDGMPASLILTSDERRAARESAPEPTAIAKPIVPPLYPPETDEMKKTIKRLKALTAKKNIHVPKKPKANPKLPSTHPANRGAKALPLKTKNLGAAKAKASQAAARTPVAPAPKVAKPIGRPAGAKPRVSGKEVGDFTCQAGGVTMDMLVEKFGIEAHPMRAKIHHAKHQLGYAIENREGRYFGTAPKAEG